MIHVKDHKTRYIFNPFEHLGPKRLALLEGSWAHLFREEVLPRLPVRKLFSSYNEFKGRKTKELGAMLGVVLLQQMEDLTDREAVCQFSFNIMWHYALNVTGHSDMATYLSPRTLWAMRDTVGRLGLDEAIFENVTDALRRLFALDTSKQRLDSVHIFSNMAHLGRVRLFGRTIRKFLVNLKRHYPVLYQELGELVVRHEGKDKGWFAVKPSDAARTLKELGDDCFLLVERFKDETAVCAMSSYRLLARLLSEQCVVERDESGKPAAVEIRPNKEVSSDSLQNPSDPDAGYCGHKGKGYQMQVMETYSEDKSQPNLFTYVKVEPAHKSDANALIPAIDEASRREMAPAQLLADTLYGSDSNLEEARTRGVELIAPAMGAPASESAITLAGFTFSEDGEMTACPEGHAPTRLKPGKGQRSIAHFAHQPCDACLRREACPVNRAKKSYSISFTGKDLRLARRRAYERTDTFREIYRFRAGIEGTMSDLDRLFGIKHLRVRGMIRVRLAAVMKATGLNILRASAFRARKNQGKTDNPGLGGRLLMPVCGVKEQIWAFFAHGWRHLVQFSTAEPAPNAIYALAA